MCVDCYYANINLLLFVPFENGKFCDWNVDVDNEKLKYKNNKDRNQITNTYSAQTTERYN